MASAFSVSGGGWEESGDLAVQSKGISGEEYGATSQRSAGLSSLPSEGSQTLPPPSVVSSIHMWPLKSMISSSERSRVPVATSQWPSAAYSRNMCVLHVVQKWCVRMEDDLYRVKALRWGG